MRPFLRDGTLVTVEPLRGPVRLGEVVVVELPGGAALHRVMSSGAGFVRTRGDARRRDDLPVAMEWVVGRAVSAQIGGREVRLGAPWARAVGWLLARTRGLLSVAAHP